MSKVLILLLLFTSELIQGVLNELNVLINFLLLAMLTDTVTQENTITLDCESKVRSRQSSIATASDIVIVKHSDYDPEAVVKDESICVDKVQRTNVDDHNLFIEDSTIKSSSSRRTSGSSIETLSVSVRK